MKITSRTGLLPGKRKVILFRKQKSKVHLKATVGPAPCILKPFAALYNPYPYRCSPLCNHPTGTEIKDMLKKAKDTWNVTGRNNQGPDEISILTADFERLQTFEKSYVDMDANVTSVPEELFRRYTETDSRPQTPTPTITSAHTRASGSRRCITPDPVSTSEIRERTKLILDLRRSHSQDTISWYGSSQFTEPPLIQIEHVSMTLPNGNKEVIEIKKKSPKCAYPKMLRRDKEEVTSEGKTLLDVPKHAKHNTKHVEEKDCAMKRRGKHRNKKRKNSLKKSSSFNPTLDPETQITTIGTDSQNRSTRQSLDLTPGLPATENENEMEARKSSLDINSYLDKEILKQLRRELNEDVIDNEFDTKKRKVLEEVIKTVTQNRKHCSELISLQKDLCVAQINTDLILSVPRVFSRSSARFELPMDSRTLNNLTPLEYLQENVYITSERKMLYNCIFNRNKVINEEDDVTNVRLISAENTLVALNEVMNRCLSTSQIEKFQKMVGWSTTHIFNFKTFCGICALCERLLASECPPGMPPKKTDPCHEIEIADFESLERKLKQQNPNEQLAKILLAIKNA